MKTVYQCLKGALGNSTNKVEYSVKHAFKFYAVSKKDLKTLKEGNHSHEVSMFIILLEQQKKKVHVNWEHDGWVVVIETPTEWKPIPEIL